MSEVRALLTLAIIKHIQQLGASAPHKDVPSHLARFPPYIAAPNLILHVIVSLLSPELRGSHSEAATPQRAEAHRSFVTRTHLLMLRLGHNSMAK